MPARGVAALALLYDLAYFYYSLLRSRWRLCCLTDAAHPLRVPLCLRIVSLTQSPSTFDFIGLAGAYQGGIAALAAFVGTIGRR